MCRVVWYRMIREKMSTGANIRNPYFRQNTDLQKFQYLLTNMESDTVMYITNVLEIREFLMKNPRIMA